MHRLFITALITAAVAGFAQVPTSELAKPPSDARHFVIQSTGGKHGDSWSWTAADGARRGRESMNLRGQVFELDSSGTAGADGMPSTITIRGVTPTGDAGRDVRRRRQFRKLEESSRFRERRSIPLRRSTCRRADRSTWTAWFLESLLARPDKSLDLLPGGKARAAKLTDLQVGGGAAAQTITLWSVTGISTSPLPIWGDANNKFFALTVGLAWLPEAYAGEQTKIEEAQATAMAAQAPGLAKSLVKIPAGPVAFTGVRLFDADATRFLTDQTVVVDKGIIAAVGARGSVTVPPDAQVIDGNGKTLIPACGTATCTSATTTPGCRSCRWA